MTVFVVCLTVIIMSGVHAITATSATCLGNGDLNDLRPTVRKRSYMKRHPMPRCFTHGLFRAISYESIPSMPITVYSSVSGHGCVKMICLNCVLSTMIIFREQITSILLLKRCVFHPMVSRAFTLTV